MGLLPCRGVDSIMARGVSKLSNSLLLPLPELTGLTPRESLFAGSGCVSVISSLPAAGASRTLEGRFSRLCVLPPGPDSLSAAPPRKLFFFSPCCSLTDLPREKRFLIQPLTRAVGDVAPSDDLSATAPGVGLDTLSGALEPRRLCVSASCSSLSSRVGVVGS